MASWNGLDFLIFVILALNTILGLSRGATRELISIMCLSIALIVTIKFTVPVASFINSSSTVNAVAANSIMQNFMSAIGAGTITTSLLREIMYSVSLLVCFVGTFSICEAALGTQFFIEYLSFPYAAFNRKVGGTLGFTRGYIIVLILLSIMTHIYSSENSFGRSFMNGSFFANLFRSQTQKLDQVISSQNPDNYQELYKNQPYDAGKIYEQLGSPTMPSPLSQPDQGGQPQQQQPQPTAPAQPARTPQEPFPITN